MMGRAVSSHLSASVALARSSVLLEKLGTSDMARASGDISPCGWNVTAYRRSFPDRWAQYLRETFGTAYAVQKAFPGIDSKTARDWIGGKREPSGSFVATVIARDPAALRILTGAA